MTSEYFHSSSGRDPEDSRSSLRMMVSLDGQESRELKHSSTLSTERESLKESCEIPRNDGNYCEDRKKYGKCKGLFTFEVRIPKSLDEASSSSQS